MLRSFFTRLGRRRVAPTLRRTVVTRVCGLTLAVHPTVFHPKIFRSSVLLARYLRALPLEGKRVADLGTGSGILALVAAQRGAVVTAVDINPVALEATHENAERNGVQVRTVRSDWFAALGTERFDLIVSNPPFVRGNGTYPYAAAWYAGENHEHVVGLIEGCEDHLAPGGEMLLVLTSDADLAWWFNEIATEGLETEIVRSRRAWFERRIIVRVTA